MVMTTTTKRLIPPHRNYRTTNALPVGDILTTNEVVAAKRKSRTSAWEVLKWALDEEKAPLAFVPP
jgi:hypothetical protein